MCANTIYWNGYFGSFLGEYKPRSKEIQAPLELSLIEALYLNKYHFLNTIKDNEKLTIRELEEIGKSLVKRFTELYAVYEDLRKRGFVVRRGLKFGCDYLIYRYGPGIDHAPYGVQVYTDNEEFDPIELVRMGRLLHSVRKKLIIAIYFSDNNIKYHVLNWWKP